MATPNKPTKKPVGKKRRKVGTSPNGGRPLTLNPRLTRRICYFIRMGNRPDVAVQSLGLSVKMFYDWMRLGREAKESECKDTKSRTYANFFEQVMKATAEAESRDVERIDKAAKTDWKAAAWKLSHGVNKQYWADKTTLEHTGPDGGPIKSQQAIEHSGIDFDALDLPIEVKEQMLDAMEKQREEKKRLALATPVQATIIDHSELVNPHVLPAPQQANGTNGEPGPSEPVGEPEVPGGPTPTEEPLPNNGKKKR